VATFSRESEQQPSIGRWESKRRTKRSEATR
jgi:hypothetical protein